MRLWASIELPNDLWTQRPILDKQEMERAQRFHEGGNLVEEEVFASALTKVMGALGLIHY